MLTATATKINRPALRYHGGKFVLAPWIISHFPPHVSYVEPYCGGASVLLRKPASFLETINDKNDLVVNFFEVLRTRRAELIEAIRLTPYSRREFARAQQSSDDPLEQARRFFVWSWQGRGRAGVEEPGGWRFMSRATRRSTPVDDFRVTDHLDAIAERLLKVQIECGDALDVIRRFDDPQALFYVDPPYIAETRGSRWSGSAYRFEMADEDHQTLAETLSGVRGMVVLSGYPSPLYDDLFGDWRRVSRQALIDGGGTGKREERTECLWLNPATEKRGIQPELFGTEAAA